MTAPNEERRKYQRVTLVRPLVARVGAARVFVLDASLSGLSVAHQGNIPAEGSKCVITFEWESIPVTMECEITRNTLQKMARNAQEKSVYHASMEIVRASDEAMKTLRRTRAASPPWPRRRSRRGKGRNSSAMNCSTAHGGAPRPHDPINP